MVLALGMDSKKRWKSTFFSFELIIKAFRFKESVTFLNKIKDMGELLAVAMSRGKSH